MLKPSMEKALNKQMNDEFRSAYLYLSMAAFFEGQNLTGFASWMHLQSKEEVAHGMKFYNFIHERGGKVTLETMEAPPKSWKTPLAVFEATLKHEQKVTAGIHKLVELADKNQDHPSHAFLQWFVTEQVEEESSVDDIIQKLKIGGTSGAALLMMDRALGARAPESE